MTPNHHLERGQRYLDFVPGNIAAGDHHRAAEALARSASHAVTAAAVHGGQPHYSRRRLTTVLTEMVYTRRIAYSHVRTFSQVYRSLDTVQNSTADAARRMLRRLRRRVSRLAAAIRYAMSDDSAAMSIDDLLAETPGLPQPDPTPQITTMGELRALLGRPCDTAHANHPLNCPGCLLGYNDPNVPHILQ